MTDEQLRQRLEILKAQKSQYFEQEHISELLAARALLAEIRADAERGAAEMDLIAEINKVLGDIARPNVL